MTRNKRTPEYSTVPGKCTRRKRKRRGELSDSDRRYYNSLSIDDKLRIELNIAGL